jgi:hypothetical protein
MCLKHLRNKNQLDPALFLLRLFRQSPPTCFGHICNPSSQTRPTNSQLKSTTRTNCIYTVYLLMMGYKYKYARNIKRLRWSRGSVLAFGTKVRGFAPGRSRQIFRAKKSSARLPSEGKHSSRFNVVALRYVKDT